MHIQLREGLTRDLLRLLQGKGLSRIRQLDDLLDSLAPGELLALLLHEVAHLLSRIDVDETSMSTLNDMALIRHAHVVLPVIRVGIGQLIELA